MIDPSKDHLIFSTIFFFYISPLYHILHLINARLLPLYLSSLRIFIAAYMSIMALALQLEPNNSALTISRRPYKQRLLGKHQKSGHQVCADQTRYMDMENKIRRIKH